MKIHIKSGGRSLTIPAPLSLVLKFISKGKNGDEEDGQEEREELKELAEGLKQAKKTWKNLAIIEVYSADGDEVIITL